MKHVLILTAFLAGFLSFAYPTVHSSPFVYDEADYMYAATRGFLANYLDSPSFSFPEYIRAGLNARTSGGASSLSLLARRRGDLFLYRHTHGPVYFYWLDAASKWGTSEHFMRAAGLVFPILTAVIIYLGCLWILPGAQGQIAAILGSAAYLFNPIVILPSQIAPHQMFVMWFIVTLFLLAKLLAGGPRTVGYLAVASTAIALCTLEVGFVLVAVVLACGWIERRRLNFGWSLAGKSLAMLAGTIAVVHPAAFTRMAIVKPYLHYAYLVLKRSSPWGNATFAQTWGSRFGMAPAVWILLVIAVLVWALDRDLEGRRQALPFLLFGVLMIGATLRVLAPYPHYALPFLPALVVFAAIVLAGLVVCWRRLAGITATVSVCAILLASAYGYLATHPVIPGPQASTLLAEIRERHLGTGKLLVPHDYLPSVHYYFPGTDLTPYADESALPAGRFDAVVYVNGSVRIVR